MRKDFDFVLTDNMKEPCVISCPVLTRHGADEASQTSVSNTQPGKRDADKHFPLILSHDFIFRLTPHLSIGAGHSLPVLIARSTRGDRVCEHGGSRRKAALIDQFIRFQVLPFWISVCNCSLDGQSVPSSTASFK